ACQRIAGSDNDDLKRELLPDLAAGRLFATVGISHLTTSRQHLGKPAVRFERRGSQFVFNGTTPWVTGANRADQIVLGAEGDDGKQILAAIPTAGDGVTINEPPSLLALNASQTGSVDLCDVRIDASRLVAGPVEKVMKRATGGGTGSLNTSALAAGTTVGTLRRLKAEAEKRPDLEEIYDPLASELHRLTTDIERSIAATCDSESVGPVATAEEIRQRANSLVLRAAQAYLGAAKGAGFVRGHHAERAVREAMFFLVWSCPQPVLTAALREFACIP
ncbi:MAG: acyl-CoA/acyl-ACP dehydrogenase, partial [Planctomycetes bacterium]|nr:acyl-CoA/acyl-ACP dehydrogenase [Planctomycetota bacterium]